MKYLLLPCLLAGISPIFQLGNAQEERANRLVTAINTGRSQPLRDFISEEVNFQDKQDLFGRWEAMLKSVHKSYGNLTYIKSTTPSDQRLEIYCQTGKNNAFYRNMKLQLWMHDGKDLRFVKARAEWCFHPDHIPPDEKPDAQEIKKLTQNYVRYMVANDRFSGTVLLARDGTVIYEDAFGWADRKQKKKNNLDTRLNLASTTKVFTGVAIAQLVQDGKLDYGTKVADVLPFFKNKGSKSKITIHQLLTHTSGLGDFWARFDRADRTRIISGQDYFNLVKHDQLLFEPGTQARYSNVGVIVLGLVIEKISGQNYRDYVRRNVFTKAVMKQTDFYSLDRLPDNLAHGYYFKRKHAKTRISNHDHKPIVGSAQGGAYSTVRDMFRFEKALFEGKLLDMKHVEILTSPKVELYPNFEYGYLFQCPTVNGHQFIGHDGGSPGISAEFRMFRKQKYTLIALSNYSNGADELAEYVSQLIMR